jgi:hypothetical protein
MSESQTCDTVTYMYGGSAEERGALLRDPVYADFAAEAADIAMVPHSWKSASDAARETTVDLGCRACTTAICCPVRKILEDRIETGYRNTQIEEAAYMITEAPEWLKRARVQVGKGSEWWRTLAESSVEDVKTRLQSNEISSTDLLAGVTNQIVNILGADEVPEIRNMSCLKQNSLLEEHRIRTSGGTFTVIDATAAIDIGVSPAAKAEYNTLLEKLLRKMIEVDARGNSQILDPDGKIQKILKGQPERPGKIHEIRMNGKNRLYISVNTTCDYPRIVILGSHSGNQDTQKRCIDTLLRNQSR